MKKKTKNSKSKIASSGLTTHRNPKGQVYYSKLIEGEMVYSFTKNFEDIWTQAEEDLYSL